MSATAPRPLIKPGGPIATLFAALLIGFVRLLPAWLRRGLARLLADTLYLFGLRRRVAWDNLRAAFPEWPEAQRRQTAHQAYRNLARTALDSVCADQISDAELEAAVVVDDWGALGRALESGGVLVASAHLGSWELLAEVMARRKVKVTAVVRPLEGAFNARVVAARQQAGVELILQRGAVKNMIKAVRAGRCVVQLIDQSLPASAGVFVPFFGRPASTTPAISMVALRTKAPVFVVVSVRDGDRHRFFFEGPVPLPETGDRRADVAAHTAELTRIIEGFVRRYPDQWLWLHRRWKVQPPAP